nr:MAG TPA: hypothetical protein [Bacteriophage sp.]
MVFLCLQLVVTPSLIFNHRQSHSKSISDTDRHVR